MNAPVTLAAPSTSFGPLPIPPPIPGGWRAPPEGRMRYNPDWFAPRQRLFGQWIEVQDRIPEGSDMVARLKDHLWEADPEMDAVAAMFKRLPTGAGRQMFETAIAKMRVFRVPQFLGAALMLALLATLLRFVSRSF